ncbi:sialate:O-sulfotransferase 2-like [Glandiceps talaboti]
MNVAPFWVLNSWRIRVFVKVTSFIIIVNILVLFAAVNRHLRTNSRYGNLTSLKSDLYPAVSGNINTAGANCSLRFAPPHSRPLVALASSPGSGNTWLRHLIEQATGIYTGSALGCHHHLADAGFLGDCIDYFTGTTIVGKVHKPIKEKIFDAVIVIYRNPYRAMLAEFNRRQAGKTGLAEITAFKSQAWTDFVRVTSIGWESKTGKWLQTKKPLLAVRYEDVLDDTVKEVRRIVSFLNLTLDESRLKCVEINSEGVFHRPDIRKVMNFDPFTDAMHNDIEERLSRYANNVFKVDTTLESKESKKSTKHLQNLTN